MARPIKTSATEDRKREGGKALAEQQAQADAVNNNMARLKALRLEREAAGVSPEQAKTPEKKQPASLTQYLKHQKKIGRGL